jgi:hypothetical protein
VGKYNLVPWKNPRLQGHLIWCFLRDELDASHLGQ